MKKIILALLLVFSFCFLSGCNQKNISIDNNFIMLSIQQNADGSAKQSIVFGVNSEFVRNNSKNTQEELIFKQNLIKNVEEFRNEFLFSFALIYMTNPIDEYKINQGVLLSQVGYNAQGDYIGFEITFSSLEAWKYYHPTDSADDKETGSVKKDNLFVSKQLSRGVFPFAVAVNNQEITVGDKYKKAYISASKGLSFEKLIEEKYKPDFVYNYATCYSKFHSNANAEFKDNEGKNHFVWIENDLEKSEDIQLFTYIVNKGWWIFLALSICLSGMIVCIIYVKIKNKNKNY